jgi:hypothetical protein
MGILLLATVVSSALAASPSVAAANSVYKCADVAGSVVYQDAPCAEGKELRNFATDPPPLSVIPGTPIPGAPAAPQATAKPERVTSGARPRTAVSNTSKASERRFIQVGMSTAEVVQRIGRPDVDARNQRGKGQRWSYLPKEGDPDTITTVTLIDGRVADVERKVMR